jgi:tryptophan synthase beta subunit
VHPKHSVHRVELLGNIVACISHSRATMRESIDVLLPDWAMQRRQNGDALSGF